MTGLGGDAPAYHGFLKVLSAHLRAYFRTRLFQRPNDIEDLVQETLLVVHNQRHTYQIDQPLTAWVCAIACYESVGLLRSREWREALAEPLDDELGVVAASDNDASDAKQGLDKPLAELPDHHRLPIMHIKLDGPSVMAAVQRTGRSESAIKVGMHRGLKALAAKIRGSL